MSPNGTAVNRPRRKPWEHGTRISESLEEAAECRIRKVLSPLTGLWRIFTSIASRVKCRSSFPQQTRRLSLENPNGIPYASPGLRAKLATLGRDGCPVLPPSLPPSDRHMWRSEGGREGGRTGHPSLPRVASFARNPGLAYGIPLGFSNDSLRVCCGKLLRHFTRDAILVKMRQSPVRGDRTLRMRHSAASSRLSEIRVPCSHGLRRGRLTAVPLGLNHAYFRAIVPCGCIDGSNSTTLFSQTLCPHSLSL